MIKDFHYKATYSMIKVTINPVAAQIGRRHGEDVQVVEKAMSFQKDFPMSVYPLPTYSLAYKQLQ